MSATVTAYIGLGSNLDEPAAQVCAAFEALAAIPASQLQRRSRLYGNPPMGPQDQPDYVNAAAELATTLSPRELLEALQAIERRHGRVRGGRRWGPRVIDLDLLLYGNALIEEAGLRVPHPGLTERAFVLVPLAEIAPALVLPDGTTLVASLAQVDHADVVPLSVADA